ncbi:hypothetical protein BDK51DRAFT_46479 [Blyttiomyces helicus]|uniref:F-box domain-containing protein n=1 Tax=Blyttiomyces helicus TaxID=388810 RepID=A0A4V1IRM6_9FUNG|nr:hypothetical protein BDK51DRAFT_46479 [Blyttiomyces helicus]|eukprot:RKO90587.1 hypothetical protein BDK51DRAFT_46479 [Blyttiomyces helicus]
MPTDTATSSPSAALSLSTKQPLLLLPETLTTITETPVSPLSAENLVASSSSPRKRSKKDVDSIASCSTTLSSMPSARLAAESRHLKSLQPSPRDALCDPRAGAADRRHGRVGSVGKSNSHAARGFLQVSARLLRLTGPAPSLTLVFGAQLLERCPEDLLLYVFSNLDFASLCRASQACTYWRTLITLFEKSMWARLSARTWNSRENTELGASWKEHFQSHWNVQIGRYTFATFKDDFEIAAVHPPYPLLAAPLLPPPIVRSPTPSLPPFPSSASSLARTSSLPRLSSLPSPPSSLAPPPPAIRQKAVMAWPEDPHNAYVIALDRSLNLICWVDYTVPTTINVASLELATEADGGELGGDEIEHEPEKEPSQSAGDSVEGAGGSSVSAEAAPEPMDEEGNGPDDAADNASIASESSFGDGAEFGGNFDDENPLMQNLVPVRSAPKTPTSTLAGHTHPIGLILSNNEGMLVSFDDSSMILVFNLKTRLVERAINANDELGYIFSMNVHKRKIVTGGKNGKVRRCVY